MYVWIEGVFPYGVGPASDSIYGWKIEQIG